MRLRFFRKLQLLSESAWSHISKYFINLCSTSPSLLRIKCSIMLWVFHSWQSLSVSFFHISLGLPAPCLPSICISHAVLTAPPECSTCLNQQSLLSLKMRLRSSSSSFASSWLDLNVATSSGLILQICLIMALSLPCRFVLVSGQVPLAWSMALRTQELYTWPLVL